MKGEMWRRVGQGSVTLLAFTYLHPAMGENSRSRYLWDPVSGPNPGRTRLLGYDVCDGSGSSAIFAGRTAPRLRPPRDKLNEYALFNRFTDAVEAAEEADGWSPESAPYHVLSVHQIDEL